MLHNDIVRFLAYARSACPGLIVAGGFPLSLYLNRPTVNGVRGSIGYGDIDIFCPPGFVESIKQATAPLVIFEDWVQTNNPEYSTNIEGLISTHRIEMYNLIEKEFSDVNSLLDSFDIDVCKVYLNQFDTPILHPRAFEAFTTGVCFTDCSPERFEKYRRRLFRLNNFTLVRDMV